MKHLVVLLALALPTACASQQPEPESAAEPAPEPEPSPYVQVDPDELTLRHAWTDALRTGEWSTAADDLLAARPDAADPEWAFLTAWSLVHADRTEEAVPLAELLEGAPVPDDFLHLVRGEVLVAAGEPVSALPELEAVSKGSAPWARAQVQRAEILLELGRTSEAWPVYETVAAQADPAPGVPQALLALGVHRGVSTPEGQADLRRLWATYPYTDEAHEAARHLPPPTWQEAGWRAESMMRARDWDGALALVDPHAAQVEGDGLDACRFLLARGRSNYKRNRLTKSIEAFGDIGERCTNVDGEYGDLGLYLQGMAWFRKGQHRRSAETYLRIPELYPESRFADDGYTRAGIALQEAGDLDGAREAWAAGLEAYPTGDTVPEATWRMAFSHYLEGEPAEAREVAQALYALPLEVDPVHVVAGKYWAARWLAYPDVNAPTELSDDAEAVATAVSEWSELLQAHPTSFYAILAASRLAELDAEALAAVPSAAEPADMTEPWEVSREFWEDPDVAAGVALARLGLVTEARASWDRTAVQAQTSQEVTVLHVLRIEAGDWLSAHDSLRRWLKTNPLETLGPAGPRVFRVAYPDRYWDEVQVAIEPYQERVPPRLFHALIREESNFDKDVHSFAGAWGLSQLMPKTAEQTAGWLGITVTRDDLRDPATNLKLGAKYLSVICSQLADSPYLALAGYNSGPHRQKQWLARWGNVPTDEYVERIPYRETRGYVKRVMGTWQAYRYQIDADPWVDLSRYNHQAKPE